jgi:hypothetical protein
MITVTNKTRMQLAALFIDAKQKRIHKNMEVDRKERLKSRNLNYF